MKPYLLGALALLAATPAFADDEMLGTFINGHMETRNERSARVPDPAMDKEEALIDRKERADRAAGEADDATQQRRDVTLPARVQKHPAY